MIKGIILDIDGVIIGEKNGFNSPNPHPEVTKKLKQIREKGIYIILCTARPNYSIKHIIDNSNLHNLHIANGGSIIIDSINNIILKKHTFDKSIAQKIIHAYTSQNVYTEFYGIENYFIQKNLVNEMTKIHAQTLQKNPQIVESLSEESVSQEIFKIMPVAKDNEDKKILEKIFKPFKDDLSLNWGIHPMLLPRVFGIITPKGISKKQATLEIANTYKLHANELLGIGDSVSDWQYMEVCKYVATLDNANDELKNLVRSKGEKNFFIGKSVDENGILDIFNYFKL